MYTRTICSTSGAILARHGLARMKPSVALPFLAGRSALRSSSSTSESVRARKLSAPEPVKVSYGPLMPLPLPQK